MAGSVTELPQVFGERKFASALDSALYHCLDDATNEKYLAALHKQARLRRVDPSEEELRPTPRVAQCFLRSFVWRLLISHACDLSSQVLTRRDSSCPRASTSASPLHEANHEEDGPSPGT